MLMLKICPELVGPSLGPRPFECKDHMRKGGTGRGGNSLANTMYVAQAKARMWAQV